MKRIDIVTEGASHTEEITLRLSGLEASCGEHISYEELERFLSRRRPGSEAWSTGRAETDTFSFLSGIDKKGCLDGEPIRAVIKNRAAGKGSCDRNLIPRPGHADYAAVMKYGPGVDLRGGGRFSGRMTLPLCIAGGIVLQLLGRKGIGTVSHILSVGSERDKPFDPCAEDIDIKEYLATDPRFPVLDTEAGGRMKGLIEAARADGDSVGGVGEIMIYGLSAGVGGELFSGLDGRIAERVFAVPAVKGIEFGAGFGAASLRGSENNDGFGVRKGRVVTLTNNCGGILGGISDGMPVIFRVAIKPTPSIGKPQRSVRLDTLEPVTVSIIGNNDACILPRALPALEASAAIAVFESMG